MIREFVVIGFSFNSRFAYINDVVVQGFDLFRSQRFGDLFRVYFRVEQDFI